VSRRLAENNLDFGFGISDLGFERGKELRINDFLNAGASFQPRLSSCNSAYRGWEAAPTPIKFYAENWTEYSDLQ
jgi:hypothetical protein